MEIGRPPYAYAGFAVRDPIKSLPALQVIGEAANIPAAHPNWHCHPVFEFVYVARGISSLRLQDQTFMVHPGQLSITYPDEFHAVNGETTVKNQYLWIRLDLTKLGPLGLEVQHQLSSKRIHLLGDAYDLEPELRGVLRQVIHREPGFEQVVQAQMQAILALLMQRLKAGDRDPAARASRLPPRSRRPPLKVPRASIQPANHPFSVEVSAAIQCLECNLDRRLSAAEIAKWAKLSPSHLFHRFRREVGTSPHAYHLDLRLAAAKDALTHPDLSVVAVAQMFGFSSGQHFSTAFAKAFGSSPSAWRRRIPAAHT